MKSYSLVKKVLLLILCIATAISLFGCDYLGIKANNTQTSGTLSDAQLNSSDEKYDPNRVYTEDEIVKKIEELVQKQEAAIIAVDEEAMIETIYPVDKWLQLEVKHLVANQKIYTAQEYTKSISDIKLEGAYYIGTVKQSFVYDGKNKESIEQRYYIFEEGAVYDMGTALDKAMFGNVFAAFPQGKYEFAKRLSETADSYIKALNSSWKVGYSDPISIKIYGDKNSFLYNTKLSMPDWAGGWYESGESIKTYIYDTSQETYDYLVRHEGTHMMLAAATNDNAAYWMQEGFATTMPEYVVNGKLIINRQEVIKEAFDTGKLPTVSEHVETNLESLSDMFDVRLYYAYSSAMVVYLLEKTDDTTLLRLFDELDTHPYISLTLSEKVFDTQTITEKCFKKATGQSFEDFYSGFDSWLARKIS